VTARIGRLVMRLRSRRAPLVATLVFLAWGSSGCGAAKVGGEAPRSHGASREPEAGTDPCRAESDVSATELAVACFETRVKPALLSLAQSGDSSRYRFGSPDYIRLCMGIAPTVVADEMTGEAVRTTFFDQMPESLGAQVIVIGDRARLEDARLYDVVTLGFREETFPTDGDMHLVFLIERDPAAVVLVFRRLHG